MEITAGKYYRTRDGRKAFVMGNNPLARYPFETWIGAVAGDGVPCASWDTDGKAEVRRVSPYDLVEEWREPAKGRVWVNVYPQNALPGAYTSRLHADQNALSHRIACIAVDWTEGEGL